jgi:bacillithiol biosynthesis cysteine-adding enzyme BshC
MAVSMECHCLKPSELPHTTKLFTAFLENFSAVERFYAHPPGLEGALESARQARVDPEARVAVVEVLREQNRRLGADTATEQSLDRLAAGAAAVVTGQQVGLFSGPSYSFYKGLTAARLARELTARGVDAVPIFWLATEDHDLAEINECFWFTGHGLERLALPAEDVAAGWRVGELALPGEVASVVEQAVAALEGPSAASVAGALREAYAPGQTWGSAFGKLMARLLAGRGVILLDPLDARLHRLAAPVYRRALHESETLARELIARSRGLVRAGFHSQVKVAERSTLLFLNVDGKRLPLRRREAGFAAGQHVFSLAELEKIIEHSAEAWSANVLLRPVVQDALLPTAAYVAGPAEIAYFAQAEVVYRHLGAPMPAIVPRAGFTLVTQPIARLLKKYHLEIRDVFRGRQHLRAALERQCLPAGLKSRLERSEKALERLLAGLHAPIDQLDHTLAGAVDTAERKMLYQLRKLRLKAGRAANFRSGVLDRHEAVLADALFPRRNLQERSLCFLPFLAAQSLSVLDELDQSIRIGAAHEVAFL